MSEKKTNGWKITAIIFIILFILETVCVLGFFKWAWDYSNKDYEKEYTCIYNTCGDAEAYQYYEGVCECYTNGEIIKSEYIE
jgi:hypothetical protein